MTIEQMIKKSLRVAAFAALLFSGLGGQALAKQCAPHLVYGGIANLYNQTGGSDGPLGCPLIDESDVNGGGRYNTFEFGAIEWSPTTGNGGGLIVGAWSDHGSGPITVRWAGYDKDRTLVRWDVNGQTKGQQTLSNGGPGSFGVESTSIPVSDNGTYLVTAEECDKPLIGSSNCGTWISPLQISIGAPDCTPTLVVVSDVPNTLWHISGTCYGRNQNLKFTGTEDSKPTPYVLGGSLMSKDDGKFQMTLKAVCNPGTLHFKVTSNETGVQLGNSVDAPCPVTYTMPPDATLGYDRPGSDIASSPLPQADPNLCHDMCAARTDCAAWTYVDPGVRGVTATCFLKNPAPAPVADSCCISGAKPNIKIDQINSAAMGLKPAVTPQTTLPKGAALGKIATNLGSQPQTPAIAIPPVAAISPNGLSVTCNGFLPSNRQECTRTADLAFTSDGSSSWTATLRAPAAHCSSVIYYLTSPLGAIATSVGNAATHGYPGTAALAPGQSARISFKAAIPAGAQHLIVHAIGVPGGCNTGALSSWGVEASIAPEGGTTTNSASRFPVPKGIFHNKRLPPIEQPR